MPTLTSTPTSTIDESKSIESSKTTVPKALQWSKDLTIAEFHFYHVFFRSDDEKKGQSNFVVPNANYQVTGIEMKFDENVKENYFFLHLLSFDNPRIKGARYYPNTRCLSDGSGSKLLGKQSPLRQEGVLETLFEHFGVPLVSDHMRLLDNVRTPRP